MKKIKYFKKMGVEFKLYWVVKGFAVIQSSIKGYFGCFYVLAAVSML